jgi:predicted enzyme related to lactoylglutathione lyase
MPNPFLPRPGAVFSADVAVPEHERVLQFYRRVLCTGEHPLWRSDDLTNNLGIPIIGLGARTAEHDRLPIQWMPHIQVADVAASVERAAALGGSVLMHHQDAEGRSLWAVVADPNGAAFGLIPVVQAEAIPPVDVLDMGMGRILWLDLTVPDASATRDFYREVVGWSVEEVAMRDGDDGYADYNMLGPDGTPAAGICHARGLNADLPPVWMLYLPVGNLSESLRLVGEEGGRVLKTMNGANGEVQYAAIQDPAGACLALTPA